MVSLGSAYRNIDKKFGGILPGGVSRNKSSKQTSQPQYTPAPQFTPAAAPKPQMSIPSTSSKSGGGSSKGKGGSGSNIPIGAVGTSIEGGYIINPQEVSKASQQQSRNLAQQNANIAKDAKKSDVNYIINNRPSSEEVIVARQVQSFNQLTPEQSRAKALGGEKGFFGMSTAEGEVVGFIPTRPSFIERKKQDVKTDIQLYSRKANEIFQQPTFLGKVSKTQEFIGGIQQETKFGVVKGGVKLIEGGSEFLLSGVTGGQITKSRSQNFTPFANQEIKYFDKGYVKEIKSTNLGIVGQTASFGTQVTPFVLGGYALKGDISKSGLSQGLTSFAKSSSPIGIKSEILFENVGKAQAVSASGRARITDELSFVGTRTKFVGTDTELTQGTLAFDSKELTKAINVRAIKTSYLDTGTGEIGTAFIQSGGISKATSKGLTDFENIAFKGEPQSFSGFESGVTTKGYLLGKSGIKEVPINKQFNQDFEGLIFPKGESARTIYGGNIKYKRNTFDIIGEPGKDTFSLGTLKKSAKIESQGFQFDVDLRSKFKGLSINENKPLVSFTKDDVVGSRSFRSIGEDLVSTQKSSTSFARPTSSFTSKNIQSQIKALSASLPKQTQNVAFSSKSIYAGTGLYEQTSTQAIFPGTQFKSIQLGFEQPSKNQFKTLSSPSTLDFTKQIDLTRSTQISRTPSRTTNRQIDITRIASDQVLIPKQVQLQPTITKTPEITRTGEPIFTLPGFDLGRGRLYSSPDLPSLGGFSLPNYRRRGKKSSFDISPSFTASILNIKTTSPIKVSSSLGVTPFQSRGLFVGKKSKTQKYFKLTNL